jgi:hypothetical protein
MSAADLVAHAHAAGYSAGFNGRPCIAPHEDPELAAACEIGRRRNPGVQA